MIFSLIFSLRVCFQICPQTFPHGLQDVLGVGDLPHLLLEMPVVGHVVQGLVLQPLARPKGHAGDVRALDSQDLQDALCEIFTIADIHGGELAVVMQDWLEKLVVDPGAADESEGAQVSGVLSEKHEGGRRDFRVLRNSQNFVDTDKELDNISELIVGGRQGDPVIRFQ